MRARVIVILACILFLLAGTFAALAGLSSGSSKAKVTTTSVEVTLPGTTSTITVTKTTPVRGAGPAGERALTKILRVPGPTVFRTSTVTKTKTVPVIHTTTVTVPQNRY